MPKHSTNESTATVAVVVRSCEDIWRPFATFDETMEIARRIRYLLLEGGMNNSQLALHLQQTALTVNGVERIYPLLVVQKLIDAMETQLLIELLVNLERA